jgi:hypothetical protein
MDDDNNNNNNNNNNNVLRDRTAAILLPYPADYANNSNITPHCYSSIFIKGLMETTNSSSGYLVGEQRPQPPQLQSASVNYYVATIGLSWSDGSYSDRLCASQRTPQSLNIPCNLQRSLLSLFAQRRMSFSKRVHRFQKFETANCRLRTREFELNNL